MIAMQEVEAKLNQYLRLATNPIGVSMLGPDDELPAAFAKLAGKPSPMLVCQGVTLARRYGWPVLLDAQDMVCPLGAMAMGFAPPTQDFLDGATDVPNWLCSQQARSLTANQIPKLPPDRGKCMIMAPLAGMDWEPQLVMLYGNPAQMMRLVQAMVHHSGQAMSFSVLGGIGCATYISQALISGECQLVPCGAGDRIFAMAQDDEMAFAIPVGQVEAVLIGLEATHRAGLRYPVTPFLRFQTKMPASYHQLMADLNEGQD